MYEARSVVGHRKVPAWRLHGSGRTAEISKRRASWLRPKVAIDLGTVNTLIAVLGRGVVVDEPSAIAYDRRREVLAVGNDAEQLCGLEPDGVEVVHPLRDGVVTDLDAASTMLTGLLRRARRIQTLARADVAVCIPGGATVVERRALIAAIETEGRPAHDAVVVEEPMAAALGACGTVKGTRIVVDIGGGTTEVGAVTNCGSFLGTLATRSIRIAGNEMDAGIATAVRNKLGLIISLRTAERLKIAIGTDEPADYVTGLTASDRAVRTIALPPDLVAEALHRSQERIVGAVMDVVASLPPETSEHVFGEGIWLTGGGALLAGMSELISLCTRLEVRVAADPMRCVVRGLGIVLGEELDAGSATRAPRTA